MQTAAFWYSYRCVYYRWVVVRQGDDTGAPVRAVRRQLASGWVRARAALAVATTRAAMVDRKKVDGNGGSMRVSSRCQDPSGTGWSGLTPVGMVWVGTKAQRRR